MQILLVDDDAEFARLVAERLGEGSATMEVAIEDDPRAVLDRLHDGDFDCVVSDFEMPGLDGLGLLEQVRADFPDLPFVLLTGRGSETIASRAISVGVTEYMKKGTGAEQFTVLRNRVRNAVEKYRTERELERTEDRYRRLVEGNLTGIFIVRDGDIEYANPKCEAIFGHDQATLQSMRVFDVVDASDHDRLRAAMGAGEADGGAESDEGDADGGAESDEAEDAEVLEADPGEDAEIHCVLTGIREGGQRFEFEVHGSRIEYEGDPAVLGTLVDVTEQRQYERELEEYRELVETVGDPMYVLDEDGVVLKVNAALTALLGYERTELVGAHASTFMGEDDWERSRAVLADLAETDGRTWDTYEIEFDTRTGETVPVEVSVAVVAGEGDGLDRSVGVSRVIADRKARERELEEYETIVEAAPDGIFILDEEGYFRSANETGADLIGIDVDDVVGSHYSILVERGVLDEATVERYLSRVRSLVTGDDGETHAKFEATLSPGTDDEVVCEVHIALLPFDDEYRGTVGVIRDITERKEIETALRTERDRLGALFENIPEPALDYEFRDGRPHVLQVNDAFEAVFGYEAQEVVGAPLDEFIVPGERAGEANELNERVLAGEELNVELTRRTADGEVRDFLLRNAPIPSENGSVQGYAIYTDITDRKQSEERINALFEFSTDCIIETEYVDGDPIVRRVNDAFEDHFGYDAAAVVDRNLDEFIVPAGREVEADRINERVAAGEPVEREVTRMTPDGPRDFLLRAIPFDVVDGNWTYAVYTDITSRKERERRLSALHEATRRLMDATSAPEVADIGLEAAESVLELNAAAFYTLAEGDRALSPLGATEGARELFDGMPEIREGEDIAWQVFETGETVVTDDFRRAGVVYEPDTPVRSQLAIPVGDHGVFLAASTDVGAFDEADETLAKVLVSNVEAALDRAERESLIREREQALLRQNERLEEFAGVVSHDLRSPLTVAKGNAYLLRKKGEEEYLAKMERALDRMERLIDDLLTLASQGETVDEPESVALRSVIADAWQNVDTGDAELVVEGAGPIRADRGRLQQLLENLFRNAVEHVGPGVTVTVGATDGGFYVADDGEGIPAEEREHLFEPGFTTDEEGTGFGLSIVKQIAEAHGWDVAVTASADGGARFAFTGVEHPDPTPRW